MARLIGAQRMVLQAILDLPKDSAGYVQDAHIAQKTQIVIADVRDWIETLEGEGHVNVARTTGGLRPQSPPRGTGPGAGDRADPGCATNARRNPRLGARGLPAAVVACGLLALAVWLWSRGSETATTVDPPDISGPAAGPLQAGIAVKHYKELGDGRQVVLHGMISEGSLASDPPRLKDLVRVKVTLSRPAYSYLIALNPNGTIQFCTPVGGIVPNSPRPELDFPEDPGNYFALTDGVGLQAFVVVASDRSLPAYESWKTQVPSGLAWSPVDCEGFWTYDSAAPSEAARLRGKLRGDILRRESAPEILISLCDRLRRSPGVTLVRGGISGEAR